MKAFVFDLDGTLLNTLADIGNACNSILRERHLPVHSLAAYRHMVGNGFDILMRRALPPDLKLTPQEFSNTVAAAREWYKNHMMEQTEPYPGMYETLRLLAASGAVLAVLSNKPDAMSNTLIRHYFADIPFAHIQGALPDIPLKPNPQSLLAMLAALSTEPDKSFYVGDSNVDVETAHNAGITAVGAAWGFRGERELVEAGANIVLQNPTELAALAGN